ncbi:hypothetical protein [Salimicrobium album]|uniref:Uncharacterized protein n=1 Tax=Salimicrobium album TaxID=50717 RepID=A0A1H3F932_9BACI|nr:hypothetical protein [Salimicrobium album]SDX86714.1 hypothetical protein SAMN04488081_1545 [Salimicrobium album]
MSTLFGVLIIVAFLSLPFFVARLVDRLTGKHKRMHRNKENVERQSRSKAAQEAQDDAYRKSGSDIHGPGGPGD